LCLNVLEHLPEGRVALQNLLGLLRPGGHLLVFVPAFETLYSNLDEMAGHYRRYTRSSLSALISPEMGVIVRNEYFNPIGGIGWLANKYLPHKSLNDGAVNAQIRLFDRYILPLSRAISPMTRKIFGQSLVFAVRKL
jgi:SAM-dependent methyltransferase